MYTKVVEIAMAMEMAESDACVLRQRPQDHYQLKVKKHMGKPATETTTDAMLLLWRTSTTNNMLI